MADDFRFDSGGSSQREEFERWKDRARRFLSGSGWIIIGIIVVAYLAQGIYTVQPAEVGLEKRFGKHIDTTGPGLHYHLPPPVESVEIVDVKSVRKIEIGYETISPPPNPRYQIKPAEALMLTGDNNIVHLELAVQYTVRDPEKFKFNIIDPQTLVEETAEAVIRQQVVRRTVEEALTVERAEIAVDAVEALQNLLDRYEAGIYIEAIKVQDAKPPEPVIPAFDDVTSAKEDKKTIINKAQAYANEVVPKARGEAAEIVNQAKAFKQEQISAAKGGVSKFLQVLEEYRLGSQDVTRTRLYIETLESVLPEMNKVILTESTQQSSVLKLLNLNQLEGESK